jgi:hypothetical protein
VQELGGAAGARKLADGELDGVNGEAGVGECREHGVAESAFRPVVFDGDEGPPVALTDSSRVCRSIGLTE